jgi:hypothetical protein
VQPALYCSRQMATPRHSVPTWSTPSPWLCRLQIAFILQPALAVAAPAAAALALVAIHPHIAARRPLLAGGATLLRAILQVFVTPLQRFFPLKFRILLRMAGIDCSAVAAACRSCCCLRVRLRQAAVIVLLCVSIPAFIQLGNRALARKTPACCARFLTGNNSWTGALRQWRVEAVPALEGSSGVLPPVAPHTAPHSQGRQLDAK